MDSKVIVNPEDQRMYRSGVGMLLYLVNYLVSSSDNKGQMLHLFQIFLVELVTATK